MLYASCWGQSSNKGHHFPTLTLLDAVANVYFYLSGKCVLFLSDGCVTFMMWSIV